MPKDIAFKINGITDLGFSIDDRLPFAENEANVGIQPELNISTTEGLVFFIITVKIDSKNDSDHVLYHGSVRTDFHVKDLQEYADKKTGKVIIPDPAGIAMLGISISHARAILAKNMAGSVHSRFIVPIVNPKDIWDLIAEELRKPPISTP